jgi:hypothetical protein
MSIENGPIAHNNPSISISKDRFLFSMKLQRKLLQKFLHKNFEKRFKTSVRAARKRGDEWQKCQRSII